MPAPANPVSGTAGSVVYISGGTTVVAAVHQWSVNHVRNTNEITAFGDGTKVFINGLGEWDGSFMLRNDAGDASQAFIRNLMIGGSVPVVARFHGGTQYYSGSIIPTNAGIEMAYDGIWETSYDFQGSGPISYTG